MGAQVVLAQGGLRELHGGRKAREDGEADRLLFFCRGHLLPALGREDTGNDAFSPCSIRQPRGASPPSHTARAWVLVPVGISDILVGTGKGAVGPFHGAGIGDGMRISLHPLLDSFRCIIDIP